MSYTEAMTTEPRTLALGRWDMLVVSSLSRLGRNTIDVLAIAADADAQGWRLIIGDVGLDTGTPMGEFTVSILASVAQLERRLIGEKTTQGLAAAKAKGVRLGAPPAPSVRAAGRCVAALRSAEPPTPWADIPDILTAEGHQTARGGPWSQRQARRALRTVQLDDAAAAARGEA